MTLQVIIFLILQMKQNNYRHAFVFQVQAKSDILIGLKDDLQKVSKKQKSKKYISFNNQNKKKLITKNLKVTMNKRNSSKTNKYNVTLPLQKQKTLKTPNFAYLSP